MSDASEMTIKGKLIRDRSTKANELWWDEVLKAAKRVAGRENSEVDRFRATSEQGEGVSDE